MVATEDVFDKNYRVVEIKAVGDEIELIVESVTAPVVNWTREKQTFF